MAYKITDKCMNCGSCLEGCENKAIVEEEDRTYIDCTRCTECVGVYFSPMCVDLCSQGAPQPDLEHPETRDELLAKWKKMHPYETPRI